MNENNRKKDLVEKILSNRGRSLSDLELLEIMLHSAYNEIESKEVTERIIDLLFHEAF